MAGGGPVFVLVRETVQSNGQERVVFAYQGNVVFAVLDFCLRAAHQSPYTICDAGGWLREEPGYDLNAQNTKREHVCLVARYRVGAFHLGRHIDRRSWHLCLLPVCIFEDSHAEIGDLGSPVSDHQDVVAGEVSVVDLVRVEEGERSRHVAADADLRAEGELCLRIALEECGQVLVHQLHEQHGQPVLCIL